MRSGIMLEIGLSAIFLAVMLALTGAGLFARNRRDVDRALAHVRGLGITGDVGIRETQPLADRVLKGAYAAGTRYARRLTSDGWAEKIQRRLDLAGNPRPWDVERLLAVKGLGLVTLGALGAIFGRSGGSVRLLILAMVGAAAGFFLPDLLVYNAGVKRQKKLGEGLAEALDLLTVSVEAGLAFDAALAQVARNFDGPMAGECARVLQEMQIGKTRGGALKALAQRSDVPELTTFVTSLVQADAFGIPVSNVLREQSKDMRLKRFQRAEEKAQQVPVKILFPMLTCIFPALFIVVIGPAGLSIMKVFSH